MRPYRQKEHRTNVNEWRNIINHRLKQSLLVGGAVATVGLAGLGTIGVASAATSSNSDPKSSIIDKIASKFNLNKEEVKKVFEKEHTARQAEREANVKSQLDQLVKDGKITQDQEDKIIAKAKELKTERDNNRDSMKDKTEAERKALMDAKRDELKKWLSDNGISEDYARYVVGGGHGHGPDGRNRGNGRGEYGGPNGMNGGSMNENVDDSSASSNTAN